jgi:hypothetical protein
MYIDPNGTAWVVPVVVGVVIAGTIWVVSDCVKKCGSSIAKSPDDPGCDDSQIGQDRRLLECKKNCANLFVEFWMKFQGEAVSVPPIPGKR